ncbi:MAG: TonB-dependent receptor [Balneola sp.]|nr:TonB-dependent receptor [Balneola sp.]MBO6650268.1 TonB-dependent receptor [Balneola sp.]MBO6712146.1 TonB-dependent receptor [Balneola sp.]MBO6800340.1 TonB-dependent receptor [Balneola sp.]MBO6869646.1 TonB-dependent receptor [Balneola sp.]
MLSTFAAAQIQISGKVLEAQTKEPLIGATVLQTGTTNGVSTNTDGSFEIDLLEGEERSLRISFTGFKSKTVTVVRSQSDLQILLLPDTYVSDEVLVEATRVDESIPVTFSNLDKEEIQKRNLGQDVPYLLNLTPSTVVTSDAGAGIGYTGIRIRGVDPARINVTINGIPVNDAESHSVFWVNLPDIASSIDNIQVQRGVGTSTNGAAAFGGSINLQTSSNSLEPYAEINTGVGSFNTRKANIQLGSGLMKNGWSFEGRLSQITSDGFIDRASSDLNSFYLSGSKRGKRSLLKADIFSGDEVTYQAWYGVEESVLEGGNRTFNEAGMEKSGSPYQNQVDDYGQDYYQLHYSYNLQDNWSLSTSLHYTKGAGYYEEYKAGEDLSDYGISPVSPGDTTQSDLIRRRWLDNDFYGMVFSTKYTHSASWNLTFGGGLNKYDGDHFGEVIWARFAGNSEFEDRYYDNNAIKTDANVYGKAQYFFNDNLSSYMDLQVRTISYEFDGIDIQNNTVVDIRDTDNLTFFNPKFGLSYTVNDENRLFASFGIASKEPTRDEYVESSAASRPDPETLYNVETGYRGDFGQFFVGAYGYAMLYEDQLVVTGQINDVGGVVRQNVPKSSRLGIELEGGVSITSNFSWAANATFSKNKIESYTEFIDDYDNGGQIERNFSDTDIALSPSIIANSILGFSENGLTAELTTKYVSKQYLDNTQNDARSIDPYLVNDLRISYAFTNLSFAKGITANLMINNLLDEKYETNGYTFGYVFGGEQRFNYYYPQAGRNFLLQVKWEF